MGSLRALVGVSFRCCCGILAINKTGSAQPGPRHWEAPSFERSARFATIASFDPWAQVSGSAGSELAQRCLD